MKGISTKEALDLLEIEGPDLNELFAQAGKVRSQQHGREVILCSVINAKSGSCPEDCAFCPQSSHANARIKEYPLVSVDQIIETAHRAAKNKAGRFGIVTSGKAVTNRRELESIARALSVISRRLPLEPCASLGIIGIETLGYLKEAGLSRYHHNLETAESFYDQVCTTHHYSESVEMLLAAKEAGLSTCSGGIFGLGESPAQRIELLAAVRELDVDSLPLNFLHPIPGTRTADLRELTPIDCLKIIAVARLMMPEKEIRVCGGREYNLRDLQSWIFMAGADGIMVGGYLTLSGREVSQDLKMIADNGLEVRIDPQTE